MKKSWQIVSIVIAVIALAFTIWQTLLSRKSTRHDLGGSLSALVDDCRVSVGESADVVVFTTGGTIDLNQVSLVPTFTNVSQYTVRDILAEYTFSGSVGFVTSDFYSSLSQGGKTILQRNERVLYAHKQTEQPFVSMNIAGSEACATIESSVTYDGAMMPFQYTTNLLVMKVEKRSSQTTEQWKQHCREAAQRRLDGRKADLYFCSSAYVSKEKDVVLSQQVARMPSTNSVQSHPAAQKPAVQKPTTAKNVAKAEPAKSVEKLAEPVATRSTANGATEEKCGLLVSSEYDASSRKLKASYKPSERRRNLVVWCYAKWKDGSDWDGFYSLVSNAGETEWSLGNMPTHNEKVPKKFKVIDVMEEDSSLVSGMEINGSKVRNRTGRSVLCKIHTVDNYTRYQPISGKWYGFKESSFGAEIDKIQTYPVKKRNVGSTWLWVVLIMFLCFVFPPFCTFYLIKNRFNFVETVENFEHDVDTSKFWSWAAVIVTVLIWILIFYWFFVNIFIY